MYPYLTEIAGFTIKTYWALVMVGIVAGFIALYMTTRSLDPKKKLNLFLFALLCFVPVIVGSRLGYYLESLIAKTPYCTGTEMYSLIGPVSLWWGLLLAVVCALPLAGYLKLSVWEAADYFAAPVAIGGAFSKLGCFFNGCCLGMRAPESFPYSVTFPVFPYDPDALIPRYPVQVFESFAWLVIFIVVMIRFNRKLFNGELFLDLSILYTVFRFFTEFLREHASKSPLSIAQVFSLLCLITAIVLFKYLLKKKVSNMALKKQVKFHNTKKRKLTK